MTGHVHRAPDLQDRARLAERFHGAARTVTALN